MITTSVEVKARLGITETTYDTRISSLIDECELEFIHETQNKFLNPFVKYQSSETVFDAGAKTITCTNAEFTDADEEFIAGWYFVTGSVHNDGWHEVASVAETVLTLVDSPVDEDSGNFITIQKADFPDQLKTIIADMIGEKLTKDGNAMGIRSESIGSHSITYEDGYSSSLNKKINRYKKLFA